MKLTAQSHARLHTQPGRGDEALGRRWATGSTQNLPNDAAARLLSVGQDLGTGTPAGGNGDWDCVCPSSGPRPAPMPLPPPRRASCPAGRGPHLPLLPWDEHVLVAVPALLGGAVDAAAGVHDVADEVPVGRVGRGHDCEVERQLEQLLHGLEDQGQAPRVKVLRVSGFPALRRALRTRPASPAAAPSPR